MVDVCNNNRYISLSMAFAQHGNTCNNVRTFLWSFKRKLNKRASLKNWFMLSMRISSYGCMREVWRAQKKA